MRPLPVLRAFGLFLILGILLATVACKKQPYLNTVEQTPYLGLPAGPDQIFQLNLNDFRNREDYADIKAHWESSPPLGPFIVGLRDQVGFDLLSRADRLTIAIKGRPDPKKPGNNITIIAQGRFDNAASVLEKLPAFLGSEYLIQPPPFRQAEEFGLTYHSTSAQSQFNETEVYDIAVSVPSTSIAIVTFNNAQMSSVLEVVSGQAKGIQQDAVWREMLKRVNIGASVWGTGNLPPIPPKFAMLPAVTPVTKAKQFYLNVIAVRDVQADLGLVCDSIPEATALSDALKSGVAQMKVSVAALAKLAPTLAQLPDKLVITTELQTSKISLGLTSIEMRQIQAEGENLRKGITAPPPGAAAPAAVPR